MYDVHKTHLTTTKICCREKVDYLKKILTRFFCFYGFKIQIDFERSIPNFMPFILIIKNNNILKATDYRPTKRSVLLKHVKVYEVGSGRGGKPSLAKFSFASRLTFSILALIFAKFSAALALISSILGKLTGLKGGRVVNCGTVLVNFCETSSVVSSRFKRAANGSWGVASVLVVVGTPGA
jgi:hypothetical protein